MLNFVKITGIFEKYYLFYGHSNQRFSAFKANLVTSKCGPTSFILKCTITEFTNISRTIFIINYYICTICKNSGRISVFSVGILSMVWRVTIEISSMSRVVFCFPYKKNYSQCWSNRVKHIRFGKLKQKMLTYFNRNSVKVSKKTCFTWFIYFCHNM